MSIASACIAAMFAMSFFALCLPTLLTASGFVVRGDTMAFARLLIILPVLLVLYLVMAAGSIAIRGNAPAHELFAISVVLGLSGALLSFMFHEIDRV